MFIGDYGFDIAADFFSVNTTVSPLMTTNTAPHITQIFGISEKNKKPQIAAQIRCVYSSEPTMYAGAKRNALVRAYCPNPATNEIPSINNNSECVGLSHAQGMHSKENNIINVAPVSNIISVDSVFERCRVNIPSAAKLMHPKIAAPAPIQSTASPLG